MLIFLRVRECFLWDYVPADFADMLGQFHTVMLFIGCPTLTVFPFILVVLTRYLKIN